MTRIIVVTSYPLKSGIKMALDSERSFTYNRNYDTERS